MGCEFWRCRHNGWGYSPRGQADMLYHLLRCGGAHLDGGDGIRRLLYLKNIQEKLLHQSV